MRVGAEQRLPYVDNSKHPKTCTARTEHGPENVRPCGRKATRVRIWQFRHRRGVIKTAHRYRCEVH